MEIEIDFEKSPDYVYIRTEEEASVVGFDNLLRALTESPKWKTGAKQLVDHRKLIPDKLRLAEIEGIAEVVEKYSPRLGRGRCAFVVNNRYEVGIVRMYEGLGGVNLHQESDIFLTLEEAEEWLGSENGKAGGVVGRGD